MSWFTLLNNNSTLALSLNLSGFTTLTIILHNYYWEEGNRLSREKGDRWGRGRGTGEGEREGKQVWERRGSGVREEGEQVRGIEKGNI